MSTTATKESSYTVVEEEALRLPPVDRLRLANILNISVDCHDRSERMKEWEAEADRRSEALRRGELETVSAEEAAEYLRGLIGRR